MMTRVLTKESGGVGLHSSASTHDPHYEQVYIIENCLLDFEKCFQVTHEIALICNVGGVHLEVTVLSLSLVVFFFLLESWRYKHIHNHIGISIMLISLMIWIVICGTPNFVL